MDLEIESTNYVCEMGHAVLKYRIPGRYSHRLLCPRCDTKEVAELKRQAGELRKGDTK